MCISKPNGVAFCPTYFSLVGLGLSAPSSTSATSATSSTASPKAGSVRDDNGAFGAVVDTRIVKPASSLNARVSSPNAANSTNTAKANDERNNTDKQYHQSNSDNQYNQYHQHEAITHLYSEAGALHAQIGTSLHRKGELEKSLDHYKNAVKFLSAFAQLYRVVSQVSHVSQASQAFPASKASPASQIGAPGQVVDENDRLASQSNHLNRYIAQLRELLREPEGSKDREGREGRRAPLSLLIQVFISMSSIYHSRNQFQMACLLLEKASEASEASVVSRALRDHNDQVTSQLSSSSSRSSPSPIEHANNAVCHLAKCGAFDDAIWMLQDAFLIIDREEQEEVEEEDDGEYNGRKRQYEDGENTGHDEHDTQSNHKKRKLSQVNHISDTDSTTSTSSTTSTGPTTTAPNTTIKTAKTAKITNQEKACIYLNAARIHHRLGLYPDAIELYGRYLSIVPSIVATVAS